MAETTQEQFVEDQRFLANTEQQDRNLEDEQRLQDLAEMIHLTAGEMNNPNAGNQLVNLANEMVTNKSALASTPGDDGEPAPVSPEEALAQQGGLQGGQQGPGGQQLPPEVQQALLQEQQGGGGLPPV